MLFPGNSEVVSKLKYAEEGLACALSVLHIILMQVGR